MTNIEGDIRDIIQRAAKNNDVPMPKTIQPKDFAPPAVRDAGVVPPSYIDQDPEASRVAKLSGAAVATEYEKAAADIERMGDQLKATMEQVLLHVSETAELFRKEGTTRYKEIEAAATMADRILKKSEEFRNQLKNGFKDDDAKPTT